MEIRGCCACCCMAMRVWNMFGGTIPILAPSGHVARVSETCDVCGDCAGRSCPFAAISLDEQEKRALADAAKCMGCGVC